MKVCYVSRKTFSCHKSTPEFKSLSIVNISGVKWKFRFNWLTWQNLFRYNFNIYQQISKKLPVPNKFQQKLPYQSQLWATFSNVQYPKGFLMNDILLERRETFPEKFTHSTITKFPTLFLRKLLKKNINFGKSAWFCYSHHIGKTIYSSKANQLLRKNGKKDCCGSIKNHQ